MSYTVVLLAIPKFLPPPGWALGTAGAAAGVTIVAGYATYLAIQKLRKDYAQSMAEFEAHCQAEYERLSQYTERDHTAAAAAASLVAQTNIRASEIASATFLREQLEMLEQRLPLLPQPDHDLIVRCRALQQTLAEEPEKLPECIEAYRRMAEGYAAAVAASGDQVKLRHGLSEEIILLRHDLQSPLLAGKADLCAQLRMQLDGLEQLAARQPSVAGQGISLLRQRLHRELKTLAGRQAQRVRDAEEVRSLTGDMLAKLQALAGVEALPEYPSQAAALLGKLSGILAQHDADDLTALRALAEEVDTLYTSCAKTLEEQTLSAYLGDQVTGVLLSMGYQATQVAPEGAEHKIVAAIDEKIGIEFQVDGDGRVGTEMVALSAEAVDLGRVNQEKVCHLVDHVFEALGSRECRIRERYRTSLTPGGQLRVVSLPEQTTTQQTAQEQKHMTIEP